MSKGDYMKDLISAFEELLNAAVEYAEYKHDGDPWSEDARVMGEMELDDLRRTGKLESYSKLLRHYKMIEKTKQRLNKMPAS